MKYKIGDKVKIRTREDMEEDRLFFNKELANKIVIIKKVCDHYYELEENSWGLPEVMIKCLVKDNIKSEYITSRFEILDIR